MTANRAEMLANRYVRYLAEATASFERGFTTLAAQKQTLGDLNRAYEATRDITHDNIIAAARDAIADWQGEGYPAYIAYLDRADLPFDLHQVRDRHLAIFEEFTGDGDFAARVRELIALRAAVKSAEIVRVERSPVEAKVEAVRKSLVDELALRRVQFAEGMDMARHFKGLPVSVNVHYATNQFGTTFLRHFFYLRGKLTPLNMIIAIAEAYEAEAELAGREEV